MNLRVDSFESALRCISSKESLQYTAWDNGLQRHTTVQGSAIDAAGGDRLSRFLDDLAERAWQFHHPIFEFIERTASRWELAYFIEADRGWRALNSAAPVPLVALDLLRFQELLDKISRIPGGPPGPLGVRSHRNDTPWPYPSSGDCNRAAFSRGIWTIVDMFSDEYQYQKLLAAGERLRLTAAIPLAPEQGSLRRRIERIAHVLDTREGDEHDLVRCIETCQALRVDHYDAMLDNLMSLPAVS